jgi:hypothetical protein
MKDPEMQSAVREIIIVPGKYLLAIAGTAKKMWLHEFENGVNHLLPVSNFYNELMRLNNIRDPKIILSPGRLFENLPAYDDQQIISAFLSYNKYLKKIDIEYYPADQSNNIQNRKKTLFNILFTKGKN